MHNSTPASHFSAHDRGAGDDGNDAVNEKRHNRTATMNYNRTITTPGETSCIQGHVATKSFYEKHGIRMELPSKVVSLKCSSGNTVQKSGVKMAKLTRCTQK